MYSFSFLELNCKEKPRVSIHHDWPSNVATVLVKFLLMIFNFWCINQSCYFFRILGHWAFLIFGFMGHAHVVVDRVVELDA